MPSAPRSFGGATRGRQETNREADARRGSARDRGYTTRWDKARAGYLRHHPLCAYCSLDDRTEPATLVDHLYPQQVYRDTFWRTEWWVPSCKACHDGMKQATERKGKPALDRLAARLGRPVLDG